MVKTDFSVPRSVWQLRSRKNFPRFLVRRTVLETLAETRFEGHTNADDDALAVRRSSRLFANGNKNKNHKKFVLDLISGNATGLRRVRARLGICICVIRAYVMYSLRLLPLVICVYTLCLVACRCQIVATHDRVAVMKINYYTPWNSVLGPARASSYVFYYGPLACAKQYDNTWCFKWEPYHIITRIESRRYN